MSKKWRESWEQLEEGFEKIEEGISEVKRTRKFQKFKSLTPKAKRVGRKTKGMAKPKRFIKQKPKTPIERAPSIIHVSQPMSHRGSFEEGTEREQESEALRAFRYFGDEKKLWVWFQSGGKYTYYDVPGTTFFALRLAASKGRYFIKNIRNTKKYGYHFKYEEGLN